MSNTTHISWKKHEQRLKDRSKELCNILHKNQSDMFKYAMNKVYLEVMIQKEESGKEIVCC